MHHETHSRSVVKAISWKIVAGLISFILTLVLTGDIGYASKFTGLMAVLGLMAYYFHERIWNSIGWGREERP